MARPDLGGKRQCQTCGTKFFDFNRDPITCPKCGTVFQVLAAPSRAASRAVPASRDEPEAEAEEAGVEVVSLEDAEAGEKTETVAEDDIEVEDDTGTDDTFLEEEEEENDDVAGLIDGDMEDDEET